MEGSRHAPAELRIRRQERIYPTEVGHLPGLSPEAEDGRSRRLQDVCMRNIAREWEFVQQYEKNNLADMPSGLRMTLLSYVAVYGPDDGVGYTGLK